MNPKSAAGRQKKWRERQKETKEKRERYLFNERQRKKRYREKLSKEELDLHLTSKRLAMRIYRLRKRQNPESAESSTSTSAYISPASFGKAKRRVQKALPKSPRKREEVLSHLVSGNLKLSLKKKSTDSDEEKRNKVEDERVRQFYRKDSISRVLPGKTDYVTIKTPDGKIKKQKRVMTMTIAEAHKEYLSSSSSCASATGEKKSIGKSKFASLRPKEVQLSSCMPHNVCGCRYHNNVILLLEALHRRCPEIPLYSKEGFLSKVVCNIENDDCMSSNCPKCGNGELFRENVVQASDYMNSSITWQQWSEKDDGFLEKKNFQGIVKNAITVLSGILDPFKWHVFIKKDRALHTNYAKHKQLKEIVVKSCYK